MAVIKSIESARKVAAGHATNDLLVEYRLSDASTQSLLFTALAERRLLTMARRSNGRAATVAKSAVAKSAAVKAQRSPAQLANDERLRKAAIKRNAKRRAAARKVA